MKTPILALIVGLALNTAFAAPPEIEGTLKQDGAKSRFKTESAVVTKVYSVESDGAVYRAYVVTWNGAEIAIVDMPRARKKAYEVGDTLSFMVQRIDLQREGSVPLLSFSVMPELDRPKQK